MPLDRLFKDTADAVTLESLKREYQLKSRDNARTPMQWDTTPNAGFTTGTTPWMRVNDNYPEINAASQVDDPSSVFRCYRTVFDARKAHKDIFVYGDFELIDEDNDKVFAYKRTAENGDSALVVCNFAAEPVEWKMPSKAREVLISPAGKTVKDFQAQVIQLAPCESLAVLL
jgi:glycosidase